MRETVADFLARGGYINTIDAQPIPASAHVLSVKSHTIDIVDLGTGALIYAESTLERKAKREVKPNTRKAKTVKINASLLPANLLGLLQTIGVSYENKEEAAAE